MCENAKEARKVNVSDDGIDYSGYPSSHKELKELRKNGSNVNRYFTGRACKKCGIFGLRNVSGDCVICKKENMKEYMKNYEKNNYDRLKEYREKYRIDNIEKRKEYILKNKEKMNHYQNDRYKNNYVYRMSKSMRNIIRRTYDAIDTKKGSTTRKILGYSPQDLMDHIESHFLPGMTWDNYGHDGWHIDHRVSVAEYLRNGEEDPSVINALDNLYPMWASDNISKGDKSLEEWLDASEENQEKYGHFLGLDTD